MRTAIEPIKWVLADIALGNDEDKTEKTDDTDKSQKTEANKKDEHKTVSGEKVDRAESLGEEKTEGLDQAEGVDTPENGDRDGEIKEKESEDFRGERIEDPPRIDQNEIVAAVRFGCFEI